MLSLQEEYIEAYRVLRKVTETITEPKEHSNKEKTQKMIELDPSLLSHQPDQEYKFITRKSRISSSGCPYKAPPSFPTIQEVDLEYIKTVDCPVFTPPPVFTIEEPEKTEKTTSGWPWKSIFMW